MRSCPGDRVSHNLIGQIEWDGIKRADETLSRLDENPTVAEQPGHFHTGAFDFSLESLDVSRYFGREEIGIDAQIAALTPLLPGTGFANGIDLLG